MTTEATPGPWFHYDDSDNPQHRHMIAAMGKTVAHIYCTKGDESADAANAALIAAAPDLLEALKALCDEGMIPAVGPHWRWSDEYYSLFENARAAIAKAEGRDEIAVRKESEDDDVATD